MADLEMGPVIRALRKRAGLSQAQLVERAGLDSRGSLSRLENEPDYHPKLYTLMRIAEGLDMDLWRIIRYAERAKNEKEGRQLRLLKGDK